MRITNTGQDPHEVVLLELPAGATADDLVAGTVTQDEVRLIAQLRAPRGGSAETVIVNLGPGTYTRFDFIPAADGLPHFLHGMTAILTVE